MFKPNEYNGLSFILKIEKSKLSFILCTYIIVKLAASTTFPLVKNQILLLIKGRNPAETLKTKI